MTGRGRGGRAAAARALEEEARAKEAEKEAQQRQETEDEARAAIQDQFRPLLFSLFGRGPGQDAPGGADTGSGLAACRT